jgi:hypothetical protein
MYQHSVVRAVQGGEVVLEGLTVSNQGWTWPPLGKLKPCWLCVTWMFNYLQHPLLENLADIRKLG